MSEIGSICVNCGEESFQHCRFHNPAHCHVECCQTRHKDAELRTEKYPAAQPAVEGTMTAEQFWPKYWEDKFSTFTKDTTRNAIVFAEAFASRKLAEAQMITEDDREADELEDSLKEFAGHPARWCKEWFRIFQRTQGEAYIPALIAAYEQQCREKFDAPVLAEANAEIERLRGTLRTVRGCLKASQKSLSRLRGETKC